MDLKVKNEKLLTVEELSSSLKVHPQTVYEWVKKKCIPFIRLGKGIRFKESDVLDWLEKFYHEPILVDLDKGCDSLEPGGYGDMAKKPGRLKCGLGAIYPRKTKQGTIRWYVDYRNPEGKRIQHLISHAQTQKDALRALVSEVQEAFGRKDESAREKRKVTFTEFADLYLEKYAKVEKESWDTDEYRLKTLKVFFGEIVDLRDISPLMINEFRAFRLKQKKAKSTINRELALLKRMLNLAIDEGYLEENPVKKVKFYREENVRDRVLTEGEELRLFDELAAHVKPFVLVALHTGMRLGELFGLKWRNVDLEKRIIKVEKTKSGKVRFIPVNALLFDELAKLKAKGRGQKVFSFKNVRGAFGNACRRAGIEDFTFHDLRRTFGTRLLEAGVDIVTISKLYGHSNVLVTQRYLHPKDVLSKEAVEKLVKSSSGKVEKEKNLLHGCDTEGEAKLERLPNSLFSLN